MNLCSTGYYLNSVENSCVAVSSCKELIDMVPSLLNQDGFYYIDFDKDGTNHESHLLQCDMTTNGGGWTVIVDSEMGTLEEIKEYMSIFGTIDHINSTMYKDDFFGIGWGTNDRYYKTYDVGNIQFENMSVLLSGSYNNPYGGLGCLSIGSASFQGYYWNQTLPASYNGQIAQYITVDFNRVPATLIGGRNNLRFINMTGYTSAYPYTRRYVDKLKVR